MFTASYIGKGCLRDDPNLNECVVRKGAPVIDRIVKGDPKYRIPKLDPLVIPELTIEQGTKQVGLKMSCKNCELHGLKDTRFVRARYVPYTVLTVLSFIFAPYNITTHPIRPF